MLRIRLFTILLVTSIVLAELFHFVAAPFVKNSLIQFMVLGFVFGIFYFMIVNSFLNKFQRVKSINFAIREKLYVDNLTGLLNRRAFDRDIRIMNIDMGMSCIFIDIDNFRQFNNIYGHHAGDIVLAKVASNILACVRKSDRVYRYGGEEMIILLTGSGKADAVNLAEKIRRRIHSLYNYPYPAISISLGVASSPDDGYKLTEIIAASDEALSIAKKHGKNCTEIIHSVQI